MKREIKNIPFTFKGKKYDIKVFVTDNGYETKVFRDNKRVNRYTFKVSFTNNDFYFYDRFGESIVDYLVGLAETFIKEDNL